MNRAGTSAVEIVHRLVKKLDLLAIVAVVAATSALFWLVPALPLAHLDDPSHWGVLGYAITLVVILTLRLRGIQGSGVERFWLTAFLVGMPAIYLADWFRYGEVSGWLWIELVGALLYWSFALLAAVRSLWFLAGGIGAQRYGTSPTTGAPTSFQTGMS